MNLKEIKQADFSTLVDILQHRAKIQKDKIAFRFLIDGEEYSLVYHRIPA